MHFKRCFNLNLYFKQEFYTSNKNVVYFHKDFLLMTEHSDHQIFDNLFVLELANNHWGSLERGLKIIKDFGKVVRDNDVYAAIKLQLRDVDTFIHDSFFSGFKSTLT